MRGGAGLAVLLAAAGCRAERLGVELPAGGPDAISQEDLQRDTWRLLGAPDPAHPDRPVEPAEHFAARLRDMHTRPGFDRSYRAGAVTCGRKDGRSEDALVVAALPAGPEGALASAAPAAAVISLAKAWDTLAPPERTVVFCWFPDESALEAYARSPAVPLDSTRALVTVGPLLGADVRLEERGALGPVPRLHLEAPAPPWAGTAEDRMERIDFRKLAAGVRAAWTALDALP